MRTAHEVALDLLEKVGPVERDSNQKLIRSHDGIHYGPDHDVQRELKHQSYLKRVARLKAQRDSRVHEGLEEELDESRLAQVAGIAAKIAGGHEHGEVARHAAEYVVHRSEHFIRSKLAKLRASRGSGRLRATGSGLRGAVAESLPEYSGTPASKTGSTQTKAFKSNPNRKNPKTGSSGDGFYRDGAEEASVRVKTVDGSAM